MNFAYFFTFLLKGIFTYSIIAFLLINNLIAYLTLNSEKEFTGTNYQIYSQSNGDFAGLGFYFKQ